MNDPLTAGLDMLRADEYPRRAREAEQQAAKTSEQFLRDGFLQLAREWRAMADQVERFASW